MSYEALDPQEFTMFDRITDYLADRIRRYRLIHRPLIRAEKEEALLDMVKAIHEKDLKVAGPHRHADWEKGWGENLGLLGPGQIKLAAREIVKPRYFNKYPVVRWKHNLYMALSDEYEGRMLAVIVDYIMDKYFRPVPAIYEFGCGTGHNLFQARDANPVAKLVGLDWAQSAVELINRLEAGISAHRFNFFEPNWDFKLPYGSGVYTVAALEQVGYNFHPWLHYIMQQKPMIVAHIEPIGEVLDPNVLQDYLSAEYFKKRGYLNGYLNHLRLLASQGSIALHEVTRTTIGSKFIEGYTVIVWSPACS